MLKLFLIKKEERLQALLVVVLTAVLNGLFISRMAPLFQQPGFGPYWKAFEHELHLSGYDPLTYLGVTDWDVVYQVYRHPLLSFLIWPLHLLNEGLTWLTGENCVQYIVAAVLMACSLYAYLFLYRILREVIGLGKGDSTLLSVYFYSFAYILLSVITPDHFTPSMMLLLLTLYISGVCIKKGRKFRWWQSALLFYITAGVTLSNGIKVFLSGFFVNLKDFFRPKYLLLAVLLPAGLLWMTATWEYRTFVLPKEKARAEQKERAKEQTRQRVLAMTPEQRKAFKERQDRRQKVLERQAAKSGTPMENHGFLKWTDITTPRWPSVYENMLGEGTQFHRQHFLEDTLVGRPVFVAYEWTWSYVVEGLIVILALVGVWAGRRSRFLWLCLSFLAFDLFIHVGLGFGLNEVFIMSPHYLFVLPIATAYLLRAVSSRTLRVLVLLLTLWLFSYNGYLLVNFLLTPIHAIV